MLYWFITLFSSFFFLFFLSLAHSLLLSDGYFHEYSKQNPNMSMENERKDEKNTYKSNHRLRTYWTLPIQVNEGENIDDIRFIGFLYSQLYVCMCIIENFRSLFVENNEKFILKGDNFAISI